MNKLLPILLLCLCPFLVFSQTVYTPDQVRDRCLEEQKSVGFGSIECEVARFQAWSAELDRLYDQVMEKLKPEQQKLFISQQVSWAKYRDASFAFHEQLYGNKGTIWLAAMATFKGDIVRKRYEEILAYRKMLEQEK